MRKLVCCALLAAVLAASGCIFSSDDGPPPASETGWKPELYLTPDSVYAWFPCDWPDTTTWTWNRAPEHWWEHVFEASVPVGNETVHIAFAYRSDGIAELTDYSDVVEVSLSPVDRWVMRIFFNLAAKGTTDPEATAHPVVSDVRVRRAIRMAIDVETIGKEFFRGYADPVWTEFFRPLPIMFVISLSRNMTEAAKALLEEAGWIDQDGDGVRECHGCTTGAEEGYPLEMEFITYSEYGEALDLTQEFIAEKLGEIGIDLNITKVESTVLWDTSENGGIEQSGNFDMDIWDDGYSGNDPTDFLWGYYYSEAAIPASPAARKGAGRSA